MYLTLAMMGARARRRKARCSLRRGDHLFDDWVDKDAERDGVYDWSSIDYT